MASQLLVTVLLVWSSVGWLAGTSEHIHILSEFETFLLPILVAKLDSCVITLVYVRSLVVAFSGFYKFFGMFFLG